jgi:hypothetical protein
MQWTPIRLNNLRNTSVQVSSGKQIHHFVAVEFTGHNFTVREMSVQRFDFYLASFSIFVKYDLQPTFKRRLIKSLLSLRVCARQRL